MKAHEIILLYLTFIAIASFGLWELLSRKSDPVEKDLDACMSFSLALLSFVFLLGY